MRSSQTLTSDEQALIVALFSTLESHYGWFDWWPSDDHYEVMLGSILVQNTNWRNAQKALDNLQDDLSPQAIEEMDLTLLAQKIRSSGYYNQKAKKIKAVTQWFAHYEYQIEKVRQCSVEQLRPELLSINGVGGETADVILTYAIGKPSFVIDAYARRIFSRFGHQVPKSYETFRNQMQQAIQPETKTYAYYHGLMVEHGQQFCLTKPKCEFCPLVATCRKVGVD
ncbi:endonuclease III domain-containing protein [Vibrio maritimus]|uniref:endonuclease III domain-containing protein n=1 Tax=Vibrio maritimus TaxID=990268 RepID=UPI001F3070C0|nr:endonuclease [Vibrio maritimus]